MKLPSKINIQTGVASTFGAIETSQMIDPSYYSQNNLTWTA